MKEKDQLHQRFNKANFSRQHNLTNQTRSFEELVMFMHYKIQSQFQTFSLNSLCSGHRTKFMIDSSFQKAFTHFSLAQKVSLYQKTIQLAFRIQNSENQLEESIDEKNLKEFNSKSNSKKTALRVVLQVQKGFRNWSQIEFIIDGFKILSKQFKLDIRNYLIRHSKKKDRQCYVLEAIHFTEPDVIRFCFLSQSDRNEFLPIIQDLINQGYKQAINRMCCKECKVFQKVKVNRRPFPQNLEQLHEDNQYKIQSLQNKSVVVDCETNHLKPQNPQLIEQILKLPQDQNLEYQLSEIIASDNQQFQNYQSLFSEYKHKNKEILHKNVFSIMFPNQDLSSLGNQKKYKPYVTEQNEEKYKQNAYLFQHIQNSSILKLQMQLQNISATLLFRILNDLPLYKNWHSQVNQGQIKLGIFSENSAICYQKHKAYSEWYNQRDFLFFRHAFQSDQSYIIADKWIQNTNYIPLNPIVRGKIQRQISMISPKSKGCRLIMQCKLEHGGLLSQKHKNQLTIHYLLGFSKIQKYFLQSQLNLKDYLNHQWKVQNNQFFSKMQNKSQNQSIHDSQFQRQVVSQIDQNDASETFYSIEQNQEEIGIFQTNKSNHQVNPQQVVELRRKSTIIDRFSFTVFQTNKEGLIILPQIYLKVKHHNLLIESMQRVKVKSEFDDYLLKDVWEYLQQGGLKLVNKKLIEAQNSVFYFILSTLKKNIFTGKGGLNISLPVTIFNADSNLSRISISLANAPQFLQPAAQLQDPSQRFKLAMIFGLTNSLLFLDIEKPFNPILGETYQCFIAGCPVYAEQISHHPPISAILMYGRGYKIHACLEGIVNIHMNIAEGINQGFYHIIFDDGQQICFQTSPAEFTGFALGQRKFRFIKKGYYYDLKNHLFSEMNFQDQSGMFSKSKWKYKDQVFAQLLSVKPQFLFKFISQFPDKKHKPSSKDVLEKHGQLSGRWTHQIYWDDTKMYSFNQNLPFLVNQYPYPLSSNSKYRQDIYYRQKNDLARSQIEKQRLQNIQREDRKKREKNSCKKF